jgi:hypothetical protein
LDGTIQYGCRPTSKRAICFGCGPVACDVSQLPYLNGIYANAANLNGSNPREAFENYRAVAIFKGLELGARLERFATDAAPEFGAGSLGNRGCGAEQYQGQEKKYSHFHGNSNWESKLLCTDTNKVA